MYMLTGKIATAFNLTKINTKRKYKGNIFFFYNIYFKNMVTMIFKARKMNGQYTLKLASKSFYDKI